MESSILLFDTGVAACAVRGPSGRATAGQARAVCAAAVSIYIVRVVV